MVSHLSKNQLQQSFLIKTKENNIYITNNLTYGDTLQTTTGSLTRILGHIVNGTESSNFATLELVCDSMRKFNIYVAGLSETNLHFNHPQVIKSSKKQSGNSGQEKN